MAFLAPLAFGTAATATTAATAGLFGTAGAFSLGTTLATAGSALGVMGALQAGRAEASAANYNAEMARREAESKEALQRQQSSRQIAGIRAGISKSGVTFEGTPLMVLAESAANAEIDALNTRYSGQMESNLYRMRGQAAKTASYYRAGTTLLSSASRLF